MLIILVKNKRPKDGDEDIRKYVIKGKVRLLYKGVEVAIPINDVMRAEVGRKTICSYDDQGTLQSPRVSDILFLFDPENIIPLADGAIIKDAADLFDKPSHIESLFDLASRKNRGWNGDYPSEHELSMAMTNSARTIIVKERPRCTFARCDGDSKIFTKSFDGSVACRHHAYERGDLILCADAFDNLSSFRYEIARRMAICFRAICLVYQRSTQWVFLLGDDFYVSENPIPERIIEKGITVLNTPNRAANRWPANTTYDMKTRKRLRLSSKMIDEMGIDNDVALKETFGHLPGPDINGLTHRASQ